MLAAETRRQGALLERIVQRLLGREEIAHAQEEARYEIPEQDRAEPTVDRNHYITLAGADDEDVARRQHHPYEGNRQEHLPAQPHQLIVAITRDDRLHHREDEEEEHDFDEEPDDARNRIKRDDIDGRQPAAEEEDRRHGAHQDDVHVLADHEEEVGRGGIFDHEARHELRFRLGKIERRTIGLGKSRDEEQHKHRKQEGREHIPAADIGALRPHDVGEVQGAREQQDGDQDEADRDLVRDHLGSRAQRAQEGVFRIRRPASHDDPVDAERRDREEVQNAHIDIGDDPAGSDGNDRPGGHGKREGYERRQEEHALVRARGDDGLFQYELDEVGEALQQSESAYDVRAPAQLCGRPHLAVEEKKEGKHHQEADGEEDDENDLRHEPSRAVRHAPTLKYVDQQHRPTPPPISRVERRSANTRP